MMSQTSQPQAVEKSASRRRWIAIVTAVLVVGVGFWVYDAYKDDIWPKRFGVVVPGMVYRSGQISSRIIAKTLRECRIKTIINLQFNKDDVDAEQNAELEAAGKLGIDYHRYSLRGDGTGNINNYADALQTLVASQRASKPVLIHCAAGTQRAGVAVAFYRVLVEKKPPAEAYAEMLEYDLNPRKDEEALNYLNDHMAELAAMLVDRGVIGQIPDPLPRFDLPK